jgi:hypothetical protein
VLPHSGKLPNVRGVQPMLSDLRSQAGTDCLACLVAALAKDADSGNCSACDVADALMREVRPAALHMCCHTTTQQH